MLLYFYIKGMIMKIKEFKNKMEDNKINLISLDIILDFLNKRNTIFKEEMLFNLTKYILNNKKGLK